MCGRMAITLPPDAMAQLFAAAPANDLPQVPNYNVCPTNDVHIVTSNVDGARKLSVKFMTPQKSIAEPPSYIHKTYFTEVSVPMRLPPNDPPRPTGWSAEEYLREQAVDQTAATGSCGTTGFIFSAVTQNKRATRAILVDKINRPKGTGIP